MSALVAMVLVAASSSAADIQTNIHGLIFGVYELEEWHVDGAVLRPPQVQGRFILLNGTITTILHSRVPSERQMTSVFVGKYVLENARFSYGYQDSAIVVETPSGVSESHKPPWEGMRSFAMIITPAGVELRSEGGPQAFTFTTAGFTYSENGQTLRVWRRIAGQ